MHLPLWSWFLGLYLSFLKLHLSFWSPDSWRCVSHVGRLVRRPTAAVMDFASLPTVVLESSLRTMATDPVPRTFPNTRRPPRQALLHLQDLNYDHNMHASTAGAGRQDATHISRSHDHKGRYTSKNQASRRCAHLHEPNGHDM